MLFLYLYWSVYKLCLQFAGSLQFIAYFYELIQTYCILFQFTHVSHLYWLLWLWMIFISILLWVTLFCYIHTYNNIFINIFHDVSNIDVVYFSFHVVICEITKTMKCLDFKKYNIIIIIPVLVCLFLVWQEILVGLFPRQFEAYSQKNKH